MVKKSIAAALVLVILAWVEMAMAPMLAMHVWHTNPAQEMAVNIAAHHHHHAMPAERPCCPKIEINKTADVGPIELAASSLPCENQHRCCLIQGPQNLPSPVSAGQSHSQEISLEEIAELPPTPARAHSSFEPNVASGSPPDVLSMILRV